MRLQSGLCLLSTPVTITGEGTLSPAAPPWPVLITRCPQLTLGFIFSVSQCSSYFFFEAKHLHFLQMSHGYFVVFGTLPTLSESPPWAGAEPGCHGGHAEPSALSYQALGVKQYCHSLAVSPEVAVVRGRLRNDARCPCPVVSGCVLSSQMGVTTSERPVLVSVSRSFLQ